MPVCEANDVHAILLFEQTLLAANALSACVMHLTATCAQEQ